MRKTGIYLLFLFSGLSALAQPAQPGGTLPGPLPLFPADNWWNADLSSAPVDPHSTAFINFIGGNVGLHPDFGGDADPYPEVYGQIYIVVPGSQPLVPVTFVEYGDESDAGAPGRPPGYPIPEEAKTQPRWIEGGYPGNADPGGDRHMLIVDRDHRILFELYHAHWNAAQNRWEAGSGAIFPLGSNLRRPEGWTSADAAGLAILPGLVRYDEVFSAEPIRHAFRFTVEETDGYVFPASHSAGDSVGALPMGARLRLKASKDLSGYPPEVRRIFQAMKTYGLIVADNGTDMYITGTYDPRWNNDVLNPAFASLRASDFEVIQLGWRPSATGSCVPAGTRLCLNNGRFQIEAQWTANGTTGPGHAVALTSDTGYFWFFDSSNVEVIAKVLNACGLNQRYWFFAGGLTNVKVRLTVTDMRTGAIKFYDNPQRTPFRPVQDTNAFATCP
ncbi:MAG TPA: hypothetical protein VGX68_14805 [Thermoanaerobaculia bacterium]|jgi:hypothetical protein|nr:hypothetical protein [Thermoanaerobaculia bacterium]